MQIEHARSGNKTATEDVKKHAFLDPQKLHSATPGDREKSNRIDRNHRQWHANKGGFKNRTKQGNQPTQPTKLE